MSLKAGTCELPRFAFHCLAILPGGDFKFELRGGEEIRVPEKCAPEDLLFFPAHHRLRAVLPDPSTLADIPTKGRTSGAGGSCFRLLLPTKHPETVSMDYPEDERESLMRAFVGRPTKNFRLLARMLRLEFDQDASGGRQMLDALTDALLVELLRLPHSSRLSSLHFASLTDEQISKALKPVQSSVDGSIRLGDIAAQLSLPPSRSPAASKRPSGSRHPSTCWSFASRGSKHCSWTPIFPLPGFLMSAGSPPRHISRHASRRRLG